MHVVPLTVTVIWVVGEQSILIVQLQDGNVLGNRERVKGPEITRQARRAGDKTLACSTGITGRIGAIGLLELEGNGCRVRNNRTVGRVGDRSGTRPVSREHASPIFTGARGIC